MDFRNEQQIINTVTIVAQQRKKCCGEHARTCTMITYIDIYIHKNKYIYIIYMYI